MRAERSRRRIRGPEPGAVAMLCGCMVRPTKKRFLLAGYVDLLLYLTLASALSWGLRAAFSWGLALAAFVVLACGAIAVGRSPGLMVLGVTRRARVFEVRPPWILRERWWTTLAGLVGLLSGSKEAVRWTQGLPPPPFMGLSLSWDVAAAVVTASGTLTIVAALGVLATRTWAALLGCGLSILATVSWVASWAQIPAWVEARTIARRAAQGLVVRDGEIATMQWMLPGGALLAGIVGGVWLFGVFWHFRRLDLTDRGLDVGVAAS